MAAARVGADFAFGIAFFIIIMPSVLALIPGLIRAGLRMKNLLPESVAPGWVLLGSAPFSLLFSLAIFVLIYHFASNLLFLLGALLFLGSPAIYLWRSDLLIRPLTKPSHLKTLAQLRLYVLIATYVGVAFLLLYMLITKIGGAYLLGFSGSDLLRPWSLKVHRFWIDYIGRSLVGTVLFADLLMRMNLTIWRQEKEFYRTEKAASYDETMATIGTSLEVKEDRGSRRSRTNDADDRDRYDDEEDRGKQRDSRSDLDDREDKRGGSRFTEDDRDERKQSRRRDGDDRW